MSVRINFSDPVCIIHDKLKDGVCPELPLKNQPQTQCLNTIKMYSLSVLKIRSLKSSSW